MKTRPDGFVDLRLVLRDAVFDIRYATPQNFTGSVVPGYGSPGAWSDGAFAVRVLRAATALKRAGYRLCVFDAYRPRSAAEAMASWCAASGNTWMLDGYVSATSRHSRGIAIDVSLITSVGDAVDMGTDFDAFGEAGHTQNATGTALENRLRLRDAFLAAGLQDYRREWWHFDAPDLERPLANTPYPPA